MEEEGVFQDFDDECIIDWFVAEFRPPKGMEENEEEEDWFKEREERTEQEGNWWVLQVSSGVSQEIGCLLEVKGWVLEENDWVLQVKDAAVLEKEEEALEEEAKEDSNWRPLFVSLSCLSSSSKISSSSGSWTSKAKTREWQKIKYPGDK